MLTARRRAAALSPSARIAAGGGPTQIEPAAMTASAKLGALGEEAVARVDRVGAAPPGGGQRCRSRRDSAREWDELVGRARPPRVALGRRSQARASRCPSGRHVARDAHDQLAAVGDEQPSDGPSRCAVGDNGDIVGGTDDRSAPMTHGDFHRPPTRTAGSRPSRSQRWTVRVQTPEPARGLTWSDRRRPRDANVAFVAFDVNRCEVALRHRRIDRPQAALAR